jgi:aryl-alcohol dehydrogenase-like predicted oxidoreductase
MAILVAWSCAANWESGLGPQDDADSLAAIGRSLELGINWIDTAPAYGLGHSEGLVGRDIASARQRPLVSTKCGFRWGVTRTLISDLCERSLREGARGQPHSARDRPVPDPLAPAARGARGRMARAARLEHEGLVGAIGLSNVSLEQLRRCAEIEPVESGAAHVHADRSLERAGPRSPARAARARSNRSHERPKSRSTMPTCASSSGCSPGRSRSERGHGPAATRAC